MSDTANGIGADAGGYYSAEAYCGACGWQIAEPKSWLHHPAAQRKPCPMCGVCDSWIAEIGVTDSATMHEFIGLKEKIPGSGSKKAIRPRLGVSTVLVDFSDD